MSAILSAVVMAHVAAPGGNESDASRVVYGGPWSVTQRVVAVTRVTRVPADALRATPPPTTHERRDAALNLRLAKRHPTPFNPTPLTYKDNVNRCD
ncbi:hypothetical protein RR48_13572 [Papilio machaon]|uniref:Uncharacterized protein n=1 Tax=Papilio machaon TaxID=76193 RepID=A0A194REZ6_PAPMA|nr:hypothetical protein RR48_13572 [Papilio machaon]